MIMHSKLQPILTQITLTYGEKEEIIIINDIAQCRSETSNKIAVKIEIALA